MKKNIPWGFGFTGEVPDEKTELRSFCSFPRIRELTYSQFSNRRCTDVSFKWISALIPSHLAFAIQGDL